MQVHVCVGAPLARVLLVAAKLWHAPTPADVEREVAALAKEVQLHSLTSHLFWGIWGILQEAYSSIPFDYLPYAVRRMERYYLEKTAVHEVLQ